MTNVTDSVVAESPPSHSRIQDEEAPLLEDESASLGHYSTVASESPAKHATSWYIWRIVWTLVAILILTVFVKGWIDAGRDVQVRIPPFLTHLRCI